jgi:HEPN domain-containing protein
MLQFKYKLPEEWLKQSEYDFETAKAMFKTGRYIYTIFMCHLCIEKVLKGIYANVLKKDPPKIHDLIYLVEKCELVLPEKLGEFVENLNELSVPTRYPETLEILLSQFKKEKTEIVLKQTKGLLTWLKKNILK